MIFRIDTTSSIPVYAQIVDQIKRAVTAGSLSAGDPLPSLRELAIKLRINPLTVNKAYKQLEHEGFVESRQGTGTFVSTNAQGATDQFRQEALTRAVDDLLVDACHLGVSFEELKELVDDRMVAANDGFARDYAKEKDRDDR